jgi:hypothetical protein
VTASRENGGFTGANTDRPAFKRLTPVGEQGAPLLRGVKRDKLGAEACPGRPVQAERVEDRVLDRVRQIVIEPRIALEAAAQLERRLEDEQARLRAERVGLPQRIAVRAAEIQSLLSTFGSLRDSARSVVERRIDELAREQDGMEAQLAEIAVGSRRAQSRETLRGGPSMS